MQDRLVAIMIVFPAVLLAAIGLTMLASVAPDKLLLQGMLAVLAVLAGWGVYAVGAKNLLPIAPLAHGVVLLLLLATTLFGQTARGSIRWLEIGGRKIQASEFAKPALILMGASMLATTWPASRRGQLVNALRFGLVVAPVAALVFLQPDLGTTMIILLIAAMQLFCSGLPKWLFAVLLVIVVVALPLSSNILADYQLRRLEAFIHPLSDPRGAGYHVIQSIIAVGSGGVFGRGLGHGTQGQLKFLPERQTDFIFSSLVEELGLIGGVMVLLLYSAIGIGLFKIAQSAKGKTAYLTVVGAMTWIFSQAAINVAMNLGLAPVTGITLPFLSAGGSSLVASSMVLGLALSLTRQ